MKGALLKRWYGIPVALLLVLLFSGVALAWFWFATITSETTVVQAPISVENEIEFSSTMYRSQPNTWTFEIVNTNTDNGYTVTADLIYSAPNGVTIDNFTVGGYDKTDDLTDDNSAEFPIAADETLPCKLTIKAARDAALGDVSATFELSATFSSPV